MNNTAAIFYKKDGYDTSGNRLLGRQAAGEGFLKALVQHGTADFLYCYTSSQGEFMEFCDRIKPWMKRRRQVTWLPSNNHQVLAQAGTIYHPDPILSSLAWARRFDNQRGYSICGVTHTIASMGVMDGIGDALIAPVQPWDAIICTSMAVKNAVDRLFDTWAEYLAQRIGAKPQINLQLPVIPLGVDCDTFDHGENTENIRRGLRQALGIPQDEIVVLFVGRLCFYAKAHPVPMYLALEKAAQATNTKMNFVLAGWFEDEKEKVGIIQSAQTFCPSVNCIFVDGRKPEIRAGIWSAADIFISLVDNIQETFGLTPIEAMAAGLPVIVSDWDGYQESVRHEIDGLRIPTFMPQPGLSLDLAADYHNNTLNYSTYIAHSSMVVAVDIDAAANAVIQLITQPELRKRLGENGRKRARETYDWSVVIAAYENLWQELAEIRATAPMSVPLQPSSPPIPLCDDPFRLFAHYTSNTPSPDLVLGLGAMGTPENLQRIRQNWITNFGADRRNTNSTIDAILNAIAQNGTVSIDTILNSHRDVPVEQLTRTLLYLLKFDVLRINS
ncbi:MULTISPECIES: glycosyltransferase family 4 protein [Calothrix]|uniref:Glycosyltransferase family 4 protein n=2 Tax=Calothrix TaxID=1186 RepID=A0ABR8AHY1_9CYAN|nr:MULTISPECIES: glycosyltransferase family 4 protein [Calothrix]MBD2199652.1 glycosyltransferase family 4 protein [Calothrix parietina FACHB-288]MBD2228441.1 glycosyltransferase family 4 protein [Calothrix anomala FACHB-343]